MKPTDRHLALHHLRARAEQQQPRPVGAEAPASPAENARLVQELLIYQTELEIQYEELLTAQQTAEIRLAQFWNLYQDAPVGYCTLGLDGTLQRFNHYVARLLAQPADRLLGRRLLVLVAPEHRNQLTRFLGQLWQAPGRAQSCELCLLPPDRPPTWVQLEGVASLNQPELDQEPGYQLVLLDVQARQEARAALAESEARFRGAFEQSRDGMVLLADHRFVDANNAALRLLDLTSREQLLGHSLAEFWPDVQPDGRATLEMLGQCLREATSWGWCRLELRRRTPAGQLVWDELSFNPVVLEGRQLLHAAWRDNTTRHHAEAELRRSQARLQDALAAAGTGVWSWDLATDTVHVDARARQVLGLAAGYPFAVLKALMHPADLPAVEQALATARHERTPLDLEHRLLRPDGSVRHVAVTGRFAYDEATGEPLRLDALVRDTTARRQAEQELDYKNRLLGHLLRQAPMLLARLGPDGCFREYAGPPLRRLGLADNELVGRRAAEEFPAGAPHYARLLAGEPVSYPATLEREGQRLYLQVFGFYDGERQEGILFGLDTTEAVRLKEEAAQLRLRQQQELHAVVLTTQEEERRRIAENLHNGVGQLLYATRLHLDQLPPSAELAASKELLNEAVRAIRTVSFELTPPVLSDFSLPAALRELARRIPAGSLSVELGFRGLDEALPQQLQTTVYRTVQELLNNVIKHAQAQEVFVSVSREGDQLYVSVEDDGRGFEPERPAAGIGLTSIRSRVELLGGTYEVRSRLGRGSNFFLQLPVRD